MNHETTQSKEVLHFRIAERGKLYSLEGNYKEALRHYREAIKRTQNQAGSEIFFQHYTQCVMEALELSGAYDEVISFCERYIAFLEAKEEDSPLLQKHYAAILEKQAIQYVLKEAPKIALPLLKTAQQKVGKGKQPLTDELLKWLQRGYQITQHRVRAMQKKHHYFIVRPDKVNAAIAVDLPASVSPF